MLAPSSKLSATIRAFSSTVHRRRRRCPVITSIRRYEPSSCLPSGMPFAIAHLLRSAHAELYRRRTARCPGGGLLPVTAVREADTPVLCRLVARLFDEDSGRPMGVIERKARTRERLLPKRSLVRPLAIGLDPLDGFGKVCLGAAKLHTAGAALISRQSLLQRTFHPPLQLLVDRRAHRIGIGRDRIY